MTSSSVCLGRVKVNVQIALLILARERKIFPEIPIFGIYASSLSISPQIEIYVPIHSGPEMKKKTSINSFL
jgi:hypothetical protein